MTTSEPRAALGLAFEGTCRAQLRSPQLVGPGPYGLRMVFEVVSGVLTGPRVEGKVLPVGGDWLLVNGDGFGRLDVRAQFQMADGAIVYAQFFGLISMNAAVNRAFLGGETDFADQYFRVTPRLETGAPEYAWMNQSLFVGEGRFHRGLELEYRLYRVT